MALSAGMSSTCATSARSRTFALELLSLGQRHVRFQIDRHSMAPEKSPVAACALRTNSLSAVGRASASAITSTVSAVENGLRARRPASPEEPVCAGPCLSDGNHAGAA